jgi:SAM-dependent methyltransferase
MAVHPKLAGRTCYHKYEIEPDLFTPGEFVELAPKECLDELGVGPDLSGLRALDIGAWDGPLTFELERRGAQVTALDIQDPDATVFNAVKEIKQSEARYVRDSIYAATPEALGTFDLVLFAGVYYHLKNPVLALQRIRRLINHDGRLFIEGASTTDYLADRLAVQLKLPKRNQEVLAEVIDRMPISYFDTEQHIYPDWSNWFYPTTRCLESMLMDSGFRNVTLELKRNAFYNYSHRRLMGCAHADPANADPEAQVREHSLIAQDPGPARITSSETSGPLSFIPPRLRPAVKQLRWAVRKRLNI